MLKIVETQDSMLEEMEEIERKSFAQPWSAADIRAMRRSVGAFSLCAYTENGSMASCGIATALCGEGEILRLATHPLFRGKGYGEALLRAMLEKQQKAAVEQSYLEVRESNLSARRLYKKCGFEEAGRRKRYYREPVEDAIVMIRVFAAIPEKD